jgi:ppGpp synthetase/RelA/SpoT-type nucleotidyltranferase
LAKKGKDSETVEDQVEKELPRKSSKAVKADKMLAEMQQMKDAANKILANNESKNLHNL